MGGCDTHHQQSMQEASWITVQRGDTARRGTGLIRGWRARAPLGLYKMTYGIFRGGIKGGENGIKVVRYGKIKGYGTKMAWLGVNRLLVSASVWVCFAPNHLSLSCLIKLYFNYFPG